MQALAQYLSVWDLTSDTSLMPGVRDQARWKLTKGQEFSVGSAYKMLFMLNIRFACNKPIWRSKASPRCKFFMWLVVHGKCLTANNLERRGWPANTSCSLCLSAPEDCTHLFVHSVSPSTSGVCSSLRLGHILLYRMTLTAARRTGGCVREQAFPSQCAETSTLLQFYCTGGCGKRGTPEFLIKWRAVLIEYWT